MQVGDRRERGASLVEMAFVAPLLLILLLGIIEFGAVFAQFNDVRHGAREGARFAAVNAGTATGIRDLVCDSMDFSNGIGAITVDITRAGSSLGSTASITVTAQVDSLSNAPLITSLLPGDVSSTIDFRLEQTATWAATTGMACP